MLQTDISPAIPLWINGRAYLTMTPGFADVTDMATGKVVRRIPLCGASEVAQDVDQATDDLARDADAQRAETAREERAE